MADELSAPSGDLPGPGPPRRLLHLLRSLGRLRGRLGIPPSLLLAANIALVIGLGTWGFYRLGLEPRRLDFLQSLFRGLKLFTLDLGPAGGGSNVTGNWQLYVAFLLAAAVVTRAVFALAGARLTRWVTAHHLRRHVIVCGGGVHGSQLTKALSRHHDVVLIDLKRSAPGLQEERGYEWNLLGDATVPQTLEDAGVARAAWLIAVTGDEYVNCQIVTALESVKHPARGLHVLVQIEHPALARFLEESDDEDAGDQAPGVELQLPTRGRVVVSSFSPNAIAAERLLDEIGRTTNDPAAPGAPLEEVPQPYLLLAGDHPMLDVVILSALRRMRAEVLRQQEASGRTGLRDAGGMVRPALRVGIYGPGAVARVESFEQRWLPEWPVLRLEPKEIADVGDSTIEADEWLRKQRESLSHVFVACWEEIDAVALTLGMSRALGSVAPITRITGLPPSHLDRRIESRTRASDELATTSVRSLAVLGCDRTSMIGVSGQERLRAALAADEDWRHRAGSAGDPSEVAQEMFSRAELRIRSDGAWRVTSSELPLLAPLVTPAPVSAFVRASLRVGHDQAQNLRLAAQRLSAGAASSPGSGAGLDAFAAWCEYARRVSRAEDPGLRERTGDPTADRVLALRAMALRAQGSGGHGGDERPAIVLAGGDGRFSPRTARRLERVVSRALTGYRGALFARAAPRGLVAIARTAGCSGIIAFGRGGRPIDAALRIAEPEIAGALSLWSELLESGRRLDRVGVIACAEDPLPIAEILLARALGARVAWLDPSAELPLPLDDRLPFGADGVLELPADGMTLRAFLRRGRPLPEPVRTEIAALLHGEYRVAQFKRKPTGDVALQHWDRLTDALRRSNYAQADDIQNKLAAIGLEAVPGGAPPQLDERQVELLSELEHGRYNVERLEGGWQMGERHVRRLASPYLKPWDDLSDEVRGYDRDAVRSMALGLEQVGWGVSPAAPDPDWEPIPV